MLCKKYLYEADDSGNTWDSGHTCIGDWINWECVFDDAVTYSNDNYDQMNFEYYWSARCNALE